MTFGSQTVGFVVLTDTGDPGRLGMTAQTRTVVPVHGCRHRPLDASEAAQLETDVATTIWKTTAPPEAAAIAAKSTGELIYDGTDSPADVKANRLQIIGGSKPFEDFTDPFKVTILAKKGSG